MTLVDRIFRPRMVYGVESNPRQTRVAVARTYNTKKGSDDAPNVAAWQTERGGFGNVSGKSTIPPPRSHG